APPRVAGARPPLSPGVDPDRRGQAHPGEFLAMFQELIEKLTRHEDLTADEAAGAMAEVMEGRAAAAHISGLLISLAMKGERPVEIVGLARAMRAHAVQVSRRFDDVFDTCGTGGDGGGRVSHPRG